MKNAPMKHLADQLATHGRYGDTMLVHMNPREVAGIASLVPGGKLTTNPVTGQPEAFLPFLIPMLGGWLGSAAAGAGMLGSLGTVAGSALGSGLATTLATGDLEQGLISGITGFGLGSALSGLGGAAGAGAADAAQAAIPEVAQAAIPEAAQGVLGAGAGVGQGVAGAGTNLAQGVAGAGTGIGQGITALPQSAGYVPTGNDLLGGGFRTALGPPDTSLTANFTPQDYSKLSEIDTSYLNSGAAAKDLVPKPTFTEGLMAPFRQPEQFMKNLSKPSSFLPMYVGEGTNAGIRAQKMNEEATRQIEKEREAEGSAAREGILRALERVRTDYGMYGGGQVDYASGGQIGNSEANYSQGMKGGGSTSPEEIDKMKQLKASGGDGVALAYYFGKAAGMPVDKLFDNKGSPAIDDLYGKYGSAAGLQSSLRGSQVNTPPAFDYSALYSGGSGYAPGIAPEFMFFGNAAPSTGGGTGGSGGTGLPGGTPGTGIPGGTPNTIPNAGNAYSPIRTPGMGGYFRGPATSETDIGSIMDRLTQNEDEWWRNELARQPARQFAEGGEVEPTMAGLDMVEGADPMAPANPVRAEYDNLVKMTIAAIQGQVENPEAIIQQFVAEYGNEAFLQLRESVLQNIQPGAQTQGLVDGNGGGMDDLVQGSIADGRPVAVSPGEYIIPADVVSAVGDGHTNSGAKYFDDLIESIRVNKNGRPEQPKSMKEIIAKDMMG